jgi:hypothetical protein
MSAMAVTSVAHRRRLERARVWLESRSQSEELLVVGATLDGANELARALAKDKGVAFGWHRLSISQLAFATWKILDVEWLRSRKHMVVVPRDSRSLGSWQSQW